MTFFSPSHVSPTCTCNVPSRSFEVFICYTLDALCGTLSKCLASGTQPINLSFDLRHIFVSSRQGILLVYDITSRWSFGGIDRWIKEIDKHAPGVPKVLVGNRLHLAFKRQVPIEQAQAYAERHAMTFFEVSPLCNFNVLESLTELSRIVLMRHGMERFWRPNSVLSLQELCSRAIVSCTPMHLVDKLPLPVTLKSSLKSFSKANGMNALMMHGRMGATGGSRRSGRPPQQTYSPPAQSCTRGTCKVS
uniref:SOCS box domain-containing protein n=1 Tax=Eptatretus burgeri TaxID=7764 RepID=A0A8C4QU79_EPTBU